VLPQGPGSLPPASDRQRPPLPSSLLTPSLGVLHPPHLPTFFLWDMFLSCKARPGQEDKELSDNMASLTVTQLTAGRVLPEGTLSTLLPQSC